MSSAPVRMAGAMVIEIGGVLLALALLPGLPWQQWKASLATAANSTYEAAEMQPTLPPSRYNFQLDGQSRQVQERVYTQRLDQAPAAEVRRFAPPPAAQDRTTLVPQNRSANILPELPAEPQRREYVASTLDRASQQILDSLAGPWSGSPDNTANANRQSVAPPVTRTQVYRAPQPQPQFARPEAVRPSPNYAVPNYTAPAPTTRFGTPSPAQPLERSQSFVAPPVPLEPAAPKFQSDIAPQSYNTPSYNSQPYQASQVAPPPSYYAPPSSQPRYAAETANYERAPIANQYYAPRTNTPAPSSLSNSPRVRTAGPRHLQY
jgi:hypothetical protein